jgi:hypothetical protein
MDIQINICTHIYKHIHTKIHTDTYIHRHKNDTGIDTHKHIHYMMKQTYQKDTDI